MSKVNETLAQRGEIYGEFSQGIALEAEMLSMIAGRYYTEHDCDMPPWLLTAISKIVMKLSRLSVSPAHIDSWHDIAGYATLVETHLKETECQK
jgi:Domain of unknown function (DUF6378)